MARQLESAKWRKYRHHGAAASSSAEKHEKAGGEARQAGKNVMA